METTLIRRFDGTARLVYKIGCLGRGTSEDKIQEKDFSTPKDAEDFAFNSCMKIVISHGKGVTMLGDKIAAEFETRDDTERFDLERE
jgi:hypothetical protein